MAASRRWWWPALLLAGVGVAASSVAVTVAGPTGVAVVARLSWRRQQRRLTEDHDAAVVEWIDAVVRELGAGGGLGPALRRHAPPGLDLEEARTGRELVAALVDRPGMLGLTAVTLQVLLHHGGPAAPALQRLADTLRAQHGARRRRRAEAAQARASAQLVAVVPIVFVAVACLVDPELAAFYFRSFLGGLCLGGAVACAAAGWWWIDALTEGAPTR